MKAAEMEAKAERSPAGIQEETSTEVRVEQEGRWLLVSFSKPVRACSWAIVGGGLVQTQHVAWREVVDRDLRPPINPVAFLEEQLRARGLLGAVGLLTSRRLTTYRDFVVELPGARARCVATVGLGNALRAGDPPGVAGRIGTINLLVHVDQPLGERALLEASAIATEAKTAALLEAGVTSRRSGRPATGTGTDCTVVSCVLPAALRHAAHYAGKHTAIGSAVGEATFRAVRQGVEDWLEERNG